VGLQNLKRAPRMYVEPGLYSVNVALLNWKYVRCFSFVALMTSNVICGQYGLVLLRMAPRSKDDEISSCL